MIVLILKSHRSQWQSLKQVHIYVLLPFRLLGHETCRPIRGHNGLWTSLGLPFFCFDLWTNVWGVPLSPSAPLSHALSQTLLYKQCHPQCYVPCFTRSTEDNNQSRRQSQTSNWNAMIHDICFTRDLTPSIPILHWGGNEWPL